MIDAPTAFPGALLTDHVDPDLLPREQITRLRLELTHDGLGRPVRLPVLVARGRYPGPTFGLTAAIHGNELNGIPVIHGLFHRLRLSALRGAIVAVVVVNVPGLLERKREFPGGRDLNHLFPGRADGSAPEIFAHRLIERVIRRLDLLIDLHTASFGRINSLYVRADMTDPVTAQMAYLQRPQIIVHNPPFDRTLRGAAHALGIPAITLEIGNPHRFQRTFVTRARNGVRAVMAQAGMLPKGPLRTSDPPKLCARSAWLYTDRGGLLDVHPDVCDDVREGAPIASLTNVFGDPVREYSAPFDGIVIGKSVDPVAETGARIAHLGALAPADHPYRRRDDALALVE